MRYRFLLLLVLLLAGFTAFSEDSKPASTEEILQKILKRAEETESAAEKYGFYNKINVKKLTEDGATKSEQSRTYRTIWIENKPYDELIQINGKALSNTQKTDEDKRKREFVKSLHEKRKDESEITWNEFYEKYDFSQLPADGAATYVFSFTPKKTGLSERNRIERIINHLKGKFWADDGYNLLKVQAGLTNSVRFGLGILAKVDQLEIEYSQQESEQVWLPASLHFRFTARLALFRMERQETDSRFYDYFPRPSE